MFEGASSFNNGDKRFNIKLGHVKNMSKMFKDAISFDKTVTSLNAITAENMSSMFEGATSFNNGGKEFL
nr:DUF285 domain-containing protein [Mycoplasma phocoeninasale]